ncbi:MAG: DUF1501 domain-containing protein, partial [Gemmataceae bacterium]|nr:DUF1501 domain-containing protein [Gemmataceae bacterium]
MHAAFGRREWLGRAGGGIGAIALACLLDQDKLLRAFDPTPLPANPLEVRMPHFPAKAERVISLFMDGGPSHIDLFDPKPELNRRAGETLPDAMRPGVEGANAAKLVASRRKFNKCGKSGIELADWMPHLADVADELAVVRSTHADSPEHVQAIRQMNTGAIMVGKASLGAWSVYGLGSPSQDLPGFVVMTDGGEPTGGPSNWGPGILPAAFQGTPFRSGPNPVPHLNPPPGISPARQKTKLDLIRALNEEHLRTHGNDDALAARIHSYEVAFRMQSAAPQVADL